jgi:long-chain acyl-CoA synthetase
MSTPAPAEIRERLIGPGGAFEIVREDVRGHSMWVFRERIRSLREMLERTERFGDRLYLVDGDVRLTFRDHLEQVARVAHALREHHGIRPGDRVALFAANRWEWIVAFWATSWLGAIPCLMNGWWTAEEFADAAALVEPALVIGDAARLERVKSVLPGLRTLGLDDFGILLRAPKTAASPAPATREDDPAFLIFTSGTTGRAKAVSVPHRAACGFAQVSGFSEAYGRGLFGVPLPAAGVPNPPSDDVVLVTSPLFHVSMLYGAVVMGAVKGFRMVLLPGRLEPERVLEAIERERVTLWMALGSAAPRVAGCPALRDYDTSSLRQVGIGGAPVSPTVQESLRTAFPSTGRLLGMGYTSTEGGAVIASIGGPEFERHPTSTGRVSLTVEVELRDATGNPVAAGEEGEVHVRSPYVMLGYWSDAKATASALLPGGWLAMGDVARFEGDLLYINARARDMLLVSAENVSPTEIEYCLEAHPRVLEAAVIGVDDPVTGDAVCAVVVVEPANRPETSDLDDWCRRSLAHYKVPSLWHLVHDPLPRTPSGKVIKSEVRTWVEDARR